MLKLKCLFDIKTLNTDTVLKKGTELKIVNCETFTATVFRCYCDKDSNHQVNLADLFNNCVCIGVVNE